MITASPHLRYFVPYLISPMTLRVGYRALNRNHKELLWHTALVSKSAIMVSVGQDPGPESRYWVADLGTQEDRVSITKQGQVFFGFLPGKPCNRSCRCHLPGGPQQHAQTPETLLCPSSQVANAHRPGPQHVQTAVSAGAASPRIISP